MPLPLLRRSSRWWLDVVEIVIDFISGGRVGFKAVVAIMPKSWLWLLKVFMLNWNRRLAAKKPILRGAQ